MNEYCRTDVLRIFRLRDQQLRIWERNGLIACSDRYSFQDLGQVRKLRELGEERISAGSIRDAVLAMRSASGLPDPLLEAGLHVSRSPARRVAFRHSGNVVEPIGGQFLFDFSGSGKQVVAVLVYPCLSPRDREQGAWQLFTEAVRAEEAGRLDEAIEKYESVFALLPRHAASAINLGTIFYNRRDYVRAEQFYRMATESDTSYALGFFDLGNVLDELKQLPEAIEAYRQAVALQPSYADAHYNLALALERNGQRRSALAHWTIYLRLDSSGPWAKHARAQLRKTLALIGMEVVNGSESPGAARRKQLGLPAGTASLLQVV